MHYPHINFDELLVRNAQEAPSKVAYFIDKEKITNQVLLNSVNTFATFLEEAGIQFGDRVAMIVANSLEFSIAFYAITKIGAVAVPINTLLKHDEYCYILGDCGAKMLISSAKFQKETAPLLKDTPIESIVWEGEYDRLDAHNLSMEEILQTPKSYERKGQIPNLDDLAVILYTSGTTGKPKGAMLNYRNFMSNLEGVMERFRVKASDRFIVYLPMFHAFTLTATVILPLYIRSPIVLVKSLMPFSNILKQVLLKRVTVFVGVPDVYNALIRAKLPWYFRWFNRIRIFVSGASALSEDTLNRFKVQFKRAVMIEGYGLSECSPVVSANRFDHQKPLSVGPTVYGCEAKIVDEEMMELPLGQAGELIVKGDNVMQGYLNRPEATEQTIINGWLRTGDIAKMDEDGYIFIVDRKKDLIISKGLNIYPREIEEHLYALPYVKAAAVIGVPDPHSGEVPVAFIERENPEDTHRGSEIKRDLKHSLANFKLPKHVYFIEELPKNATGKVLKRVLKENLDQYTENEG